MVGMGETKAFSRMHPHVKEKSGINTKKEMQADIDRSFRFRIPDLPRAEILFYFSVWIAHSCYAFYAVYTVSVEYRDRLWGGFFEPGWSILGYPRQDTSNYEWKIWTSQLYRFLPWFVVHFFVFNFSSGFISPKIHQKLCLIIWVAAVVYVYSWIILPGIFLCSTIVLITAYWIRSKIAVWIVAVILLFGMGVMGREYLIIWVDSDMIYQWEVLVAYKLLQAISFGSWLIDLRPEHDKPNFMDCLLKLIHYSLYLPYLISLIVLYPDFEQQMELRHSSDRQWSKIFLLTLRIIFWALFVDGSLHCLYYSAFLSDLQALQNLNLPSLCAIGYVAGQMFHVKYMVIFGVPVIFGRLDRMNPPWGPICISRVALYSNMWRYFDRGLYAFIRDLIFIPISKPDFTYGKRLFATVLSFLFVWIWHGPTYYYFIWIGLNFLEINLENIGKFMHQCKFFRAHVDNWVSQRNLRRALAVVEIPCVTMGILAIFYFLGEDTGWVFIDRVVIENVLNLTWKFAWLIALGYCYCQVCMELQKWDRDKNQNKNIYA